MGGPMSGRSRTLYLTLAAMTVITIVVSIQPSIGLRQLRNLLYPGKEARVFGRCRIQARNGR